MTAQRKTTTGLRGGIDAARWALALCAAAAPPAIADTAPAPPASQPAPSAPPGETPPAPLGETPSAPPGETPSAPPGETPPAPLGETVSVLGAAQSASEDKTLPIVLGTSVYPTIMPRIGQPRFDPTSTLLVNSIGARTGLFGAAAREGSTWVERYVPGTDQTGFVQLYALSTSGHYGAFFGSRSSDNHAGAPDNVIGSISLVVADSDLPHRHWARYAEGYVPRGQTAFRLLINDENSIQNDASAAPLADPYDVNPQHLLNNLRVDCGIGAVSASSCTNPISILNNGATYRTGIVFGADSIDLREGLATAIALPVNYGTSWYAAPGTPTWRVYADARKASAGRLVMSDDALTIRIGAADTPAFSVEKDAIRTPAVIAVGTPPAMSGDCPVRDQLGGASAGAFVLARNCAVGKIRLRFATAAPTGWSCFASNMMRASAAFREIAFDRSGVTLAVTDAKQFDRVVFACSGF